jgi:phasin family protein
MHSIQDQFSAATKANFEANLALVSALTSKAFEGVEKLVDLNLGVVKATLEESNAKTKQLLGAKDTQEFFSMSAAQGQPSAEKAIAYARHIGSIASTTQSEIIKTAEAQIAETNRKISALIDDVSKNAPAGSESVVAMLKSLIGNANAGYEQLTKATKQAVEALETNLSTAAEQFTQAAEKNASRAKK